MTKNPIISVIIPTYNRANLIDQAIQSVLNQTYQNFEVIIVDDGSTDYTKEVIRKFQERDKRVKYIRHEKNRGGSAARNTGIKAAKGEYIAFLDSDDEWLPEKINLQIAVFKKGSDNLGVVYCDVMIKNNDEKIVNSHYFFPQCRGYIYDFMLKRCALVPCSVLIVKKECFQQIGLFNEQFFACQDNDICIRLAKYYEFDFIPKPLVIFHVHKGLRISNNKLRVAQASFNIITMYKDEIVRYCGNKTLSYHYSNIGRCFIRADEFTRAREMFIKSICIYPFLVYPLFYWGILIIPSILIILRTLKRKVYNFIRGLRIFL